MVGNAVHGHGRQMKKPGDVTSLEILKLQAKKLENAKVMAKKLNNPPLPHETLRINTRLTRS